MSITAGVLRGQMRWPAFICAMVLLAWRRVGVRAGAGCSGQNNCNGHGICRNTYSYCDCYVGWGAKTDIADYKAPDCSLSEYVWLAVLFCEWMAVWYSRACWNASLLYIPRFNRWDFRPLNQRFWQWPQGSARRGGRGETCQGGPRPPTGWRSALVAVPVTGVLGCANARLDSAATPASVRTASTTALATGSA
jgi:hypothetical protein